MATRITVPHLDANILDVTVTAWRKRVGDRVETGECVVELTTDKAAFELESPGAGLLLEILAPEKSVVPSGFILALLGDPGEKDPDAAGLNLALLEKYRTEAGNRKTENGRQKSEADTRHSTPDTRPPPPATRHPQPPAPAARVRATPRTRRLAQERGIDLAHVRSETGAEVIDEAVLQAYLRKVMCPSHVGGAPDGLVPPEREF
jgi:pyruvate dehydrogenase E2 component (dihydrolipoamide acetyltransferase)